MLEANKLALPEEKHLPGVNARPNDGFLHAIAQQAHEQTSDDRATANVPWLYGIRLINEGFYWEAHEVLEAVWMKALPNSRERFLVQCLIHISNARLKLALKQEHAATRLQGLAVYAAERALSGYQGHLMGLDSSKVMSAAVGCAEASTSIGIELI